MYIFLLAWRYLRTRFIALASIVSVTLGVATLIVVNSVMSGFVHEMYTRLHGILSDVEVASPGLGEIYGSQYRLRQIEDIVGEELDASTCVVQVPSLLQFEYHGRPMTQPITLIGIDDQTYGRVTDFQPYLLNANLRRSLSFQLQEDGYDPRLEEAGWPYRRRQALFRYEQAASDLGPSAAPHEDPSDAAPAADPSPHFVPLPAAPPTLADDEDAGPSPSGQPERGELTLSDPFAATRQQLHPESVFDPLRDQHTGIILGLAISSRVYRDSGQQRELYLLRPGDDVRVTLPTAGSAPAPITQNCTVVDFYHSKMHEYDANFAFMPLSQLQQIRGMIDPSNGLRSVSAIQLKLRPGSDLAAVRDRLAAVFPPDTYPFVVQTWQDAQRPLLSAVMMELTILNLLLFLIIAVAGFGILATFYMIVVEKTKDIGVLKALGASRGGVMSIFLGYGFSLGIAGTGAGIGLGLLIVSQINRIADGIQWLTGREVFDPTMYYFSEIPTIVRVGCIAWVACGAISIAVLASVLPALRAARLHPVEALRYE